MIGQSVGGREPKKKKDEIGMHTGDIRNGREGRREEAEAEVEGRSDPSARSTHHFFYVEESPFAFSFSAYGLACA